MQSLKEPTVKNLTKPDIEQHVKPVAAPELEMLAEVSLKENKQPQSWEPEICKGIQDYTN